MAKFTINNTFDFPLENLILARKCVAATAPSHRTLAVIFRTMLHQDELSLLRKSLESKESFQPLLQFFLQKSIEETKAKEKSPEIQHNYSNFYSAFIENYSKINTDLIFENCQSTKGRFFKSFIILLFIKMEYSDFLFYNTFIQKKNIS